VAIAYYCDLVFAPEPDRQKIREDWLNFRRPAWQKAFARVPKKKREATEQGVRFSREPSALSYFHRYLKRFPLRQRQPLVELKHPTIRALIEKLCAKGYFWSAYTRCVEKIQNAFLVYKGIDPDGFKRPKISRSRPR
jgi:hypothetical protein